MSNYHVEPASKPKALTKEALKAVRHEQVQGLSRRQLIRTSLAAGVGVSLALGCDIILASEKSSFLLAFTKIGHHRAVKIRLDSNNGQLRAGMSATAHFEALQPGAEKK